MTRPDYNWKLPPEITRRLGHDTYGAQRAIHEAGHQLVILHEPPTSESHAREHRVFLRTPEGKWLCHGNDHGEHMMTDLLDRYESALSREETRYARAETADDLFPLLDTLLPLARAATNLRDALQQARDQVKEDTRLITWRDRAVDLARGLELLLANARIALEYRLAHQAEEQTQAALLTTRAQFKLNTIAALTAPLMAIATVFGMNLHHGMETWPTWAFWAVFAVGLLIGVWVKGWVQAMPPPPEAPRGKPGGRQAGKSTTKRKTA